MRRLALALALLLPIGVPAIEAATCGGTKLVFVKKVVRAALVCHQQAAASGTVVDGSCVAATEAALTRGFLSAESRGGCSLTADRASVGVALDAFVAAVVGSLHTSVTVSPCGATKLGATGRAANAALNCHRKAERQGTDVAEKCVTRARVALLGTFQSADATGSCIATGDGAAIATLLDDWSEEVAGLLRPVRRVSVSSAGRQARLPSTEDRISSVKPDISADGRVVVFNSNAEDLVAGDANGNDFYDILAHDVVTGITELVTVATDGTQVDGDPAGFAVVSADGRYVAFDSRGTTLVPEDTNVAADVFVRDRLLRTTERVSVTSAGGQSAALRRPDSIGPTISADGRFVGFYSFASNLAPNDTNTVADVFVRDRLAGTTDLVSVAMGGTSGNGDSVNPTLSADGRWIAFWSSASDLVPGDVAGTDDVFLVDRTSGTIELVSATWDGGSNDAPLGEGSFSRPAISHDARYVAFSHAAGNLVSDDTNGFVDVFVRDRSLGTTERLSVGLGGIEANGRSVFTAMSADGRFVAFESEASNLVDGDTNGVADVFVVDRQTHGIVRVSVGSDGTESNDFSSKPAMSADGRRIVFYSKASNLVPKDDNGKYLGYDVFLRSLEWP